MSVEIQNEKIETGDVQRFLAFTLSMEEFAIPLLAVKEVIAIPDITPIPYTPPHFLGIMNLRGQVISVIDLRLKFNMKAERSEETAVIICDLSPLCIGIVVNSVNQVLSLSQDDVQPKPEIESNKRSDYITGVTQIDRKLVLLLDLAKTLNVEDHMAIKNATAKTA